MKYTHILLFSLLIVSCGTLPVAAPSPQPTSAPTSAPLPTLPRPTTGILPRTLTPLPPRMATPTQAPTLAPSRAEPAVEWTKTFGQAPSPELAKKVRQTSEGGYILVGGATRPGGHYAYLVKTDSSGNLQWEKTLGDGTDDWGFDAQQTSDGGYILAGQTQVGEGRIMPNGRPMTIFNVYVVKTDTAGNLIWEKTFGGKENNAKGRPIKITPDGNYIVAGTIDTGGNGDNDFYLLKIDSNGNMLWGKRITKPVTRDNCWDMDITADGGYILAGETMKGPRLGEDDIDVFVVRTDADGNILWTKTFGKTGTRLNDWARGVQQTSDGGYILAGMTTSADGNKDAFLIKLAKEATLPSREPLE